MVIASCSEISAEQHFMFHTSFRLITACFVESFATELSFTATFQPC